MNVTDVLIILAKSDVQVPTVPAGSLNTAQTIIALVAAVVAAAGGGGTVVALITARVRKVRQYSDVREDATVENQGLKDAAEMWQSIAVDAREQAKSALGELRGVIEDKDRQIQDQRMIIDDLHALIKIRDQNAEDADRKLAEVQSRLQSAERRERELVESRRQIEERLRDAEMHMAETTLDPARIREINAHGTDSDRHGLHPLN